MVRQAVQHRVGGHVPYLRKEKSEPKLEMVELKVRERLKKEHFIEKTATIYK